MTVSQDLSPEEVAALDEVHRAEAERRLVDPLSIATFLDPQGVHERAHLRLIADEIAKVGTGVHDRIQIRCPPQSGKSVLAAAWTPFWWLARNPTDKVLVASYGNALAITRGKQIKRLVERFGWRFGIEVERGSGAVNDWTISHGGGVRSAGVGGALTGFPGNCVAGETAVATTEGDIRADELARMRHQPMAAAWNHNTGRFEWRRIVATQITANRHLVEVRTTRGRVLRCTPDHLAYVPGSGYRPAASLIPELSLLVGVCDGEAGWPWTCVMRASGDTVEHVRTLDAIEDVYDFQVEGLENFLANGLLVHNCGIVDDSIKSRQEAESPVYRERVWDWYSADFLSRMSPGAPVVMIGTPWSDDDLLHRVIKQDGTVEEGGAWRVVSLPAFAGANDPIGREPGDPLTHPRIDPADAPRLREFWETRRSQTSSRDWASLYMLDPKPVENALVSEQLLRERTHNPPPSTPQKTAVAIDPSGGGRDEAGIVGGFLGDDQRVYITHDRSMIGPTEKWAKAAVYLAGEVDADVIVFEKNFGGDMAGVVIKTAWETAQRQHPGDKRFARIPPRVEPVQAKKGKLLRAEPIAQQIADDYVRLGAHLPELSFQWQSWMPTDPESPGRIDASVYLAFALLPLHNQPATIAAHPALTTPQDPFAQRFSAGFMSPGARGRGGPPRPFG